MAETVAEALWLAARRLGAVTDTGRLDAELLMAEALGVSRSELLLRHTGAAVPERFAALVARRERHEPVAYILGKQEFFGRRFAVYPGVLIPRPDSETTVEAALEAAPAAARVLDCGVGSGALLLSMLAERPDAIGTGLDRSREALACAACNATALDLGERATLVQRDWHQEGWAADLGRFDLILANPPYVEDEAELAPDVRDWEPAGALFAGPEGLDDYRVLIPQLPGLLTERGAAVLEIGASQADAVERIAMEAGFRAVLHRDIAARPRAFVLRFALGR